MIVQADLCRTWSETDEDWFFRIPAQVYLWLHHCLENTVIELMSDQYAFCQSVSKYEIIKFLPEINLLGRLNIINQFK